MRPMQKMAEGARESANIKPSRAPVPPVPIKFPPLVPTIPKFPTSVFKSSTRRNCSGPSIFANSPENIQSIRISAAQA